MSASRLPSLAALHLLALAAATAQDAITNGDFDAPDVPANKAQTGIAVPGWSGVKFLVDGNAGAPLPTAPADQQFAGPSGGVLAQSITVPTGMKLDALSWKTTAAANVGTVQFLVRIHKGDGTPLHESVFKAFGGADADTWDDRTFALPTPLPAGPYSLRFQRHAATPGEFFVDEVSAPISPVATTIDPRAKHAWCANTGWVNFAPSADDGVLTTEGFLARYAYAANTGWVYFGDGSPADGIAYSNASGEDSGVNVAPSGDLSGLAWGANTGWINFGWTHAGDANRPRIDLATGEFKGYAWAANIGWWNLGAGELFTNTLHCIDADGDGIGDGWEQQHFGNLSAANATSDADGDGVRDAGEYLSLSDPDDPASYLTILRQTPGDFFQKVQLVFTSSPGRLYRIELSGDLESWADSGLGAFLPDAGATTRRIVNLPAGDRHFYRVLAVKPLQ